MTKGTLAKYKRIINEWFANGFNGREAYKKFFPKAKDSTATCNFSKIKDSKELKEYIAVKHEEAAKLIDMSHKGVLSELKRWLELDITQTFGLSVEEIKKLPVEVRRLITRKKETFRQIHNSKGEVIETITSLELWFVSKEVAMEKVNKHLGFYELDNTQKATEINIVATNEAHKDLIEGIINGNE